VTSARAASVPAGLRLGVAAGGGVPWTALPAFFALPDDIDGYRLTAKRLLNLYLNRWELLRVRSVLRSRPSRLVVEPTNVCNLRCPYCHTGAGRFARRPAKMDLTTYRRVLDEIGDYLLLIELFNWGEAMLHPDLPAFVAAASERGIATRVNSHLSIPFTSADAEQLVASGLTDLFVAIDGATQEVYERYRVGGDLARVVDNCRLIAAAKRRRGSDRPRLTLQFLEFPFNVGELPAVRRLAASLDMRVFAFRGAVPDPEWGKQSGAPPWFLTSAPGPCPFLWGQPVLTVDGHVAPCRGAFRSADDFVEPGNPGPKTFREAWNAERYRTARALFRGRTGTAAERELPCFTCPTLAFHERWREHRNRGGTLATFDPGISTNANGPWNYFWNRGKAAAATRSVAAV